MTVEIAKLRREWMCHAPMMDCLDEIERLQLEVDAHNDASTPAFDEIAALCGCPEWEYPGQVVRDVQGVVDERDRLRADTARVPADVAAMRMLRDDFTKERAHRDAINSGGQHVGHTNSMFTSANPSIMIRFERLLRDAVTVTANDDSTIVQLRAALTEALDGWDGCVPFMRLVAPRDVLVAEGARIAELRKLVSP